ncbi:hypothetical protein E2562_014747 [Oryza meyeriana var. granulata]|uniref:Uncharacterized protein n=1 Tax=Oryza meyeriana var. granulata TaxID=110450 RepID=A0A6G1BKY5_9ORYZ|nr:hypothetical protein E2562_014747 [Oryza meyeriana var. granulata]
MAVVRSGDRSMVAYDRALSVLKGLRKQLEGIPANIGVAPVGAESSRDGNSTDEHVVRPGTSTAANADVDAAISRRPSPKSKTKGRTSDGNETIVFGTSGDK